jgi:sugar phosphate isomerase/epimerase
VHPIGVMLNNLEPNRLAAFAVAARLGFQLVHTSSLPESWLEGDSRHRYVAAARESGLTIDTMFVGFDGQSYADLPAIKRTVGLVIPELREHRHQIALKYCSLAVGIRSPSLSAHIGFIPESLSADYKVLVLTVQDIADHCAAAGLTFHLETGQDSAMVLADFLADVARPNTGVNFDPANFVLYGTDDPSHAFEVLAGHVRGVHCKDALPSPTRGILGPEVPLGRGVVDFPGLLRGLKGIGYDGPLVIEREHGSNVVNEVLAGRSYLEKILKGL